ncbi:MAG: hypothetical protein Q9222_004331 [Ikaeria aurantiellina]
MYYKLFLPLQLFYFSSAFAIKTSLILLYYRIFAVHRWFRFELLGAWIIVVLYYLVNSFVAVFECKPVAFFWDKNIEGGTCINQNQFFRWNGVANLLPLFRLLVTKTASSKDRAYSRGASSKAVNALHLSSKSAKGLGNASGGGFSRLNEQQGLDSCITTRVTAEHIEMGDAPAGIVRDQTIEQHHDIVSDF